MSDPKSSANIRHDFSVDFVEMHCSAATKDLCTLASMTTLGGVNATGGELSDLIGGFYEAGLGDADWPDVLARLAARIGGEGVTLNHSSRAGQRDALIFADLDPAFLAPYNAYYRHINPFLAGVRRLPADDAVSIDQMLMPRSELERTEYYNDFLAPHGLHNLLSLATVDDAGQSVYIGIWRSRRQPPWGEEEMRLLHHLGPHVGRALRTDRRLAGEARRRAAQAAVSPPLSRRERDCLGCIARGATSRIAASELGLSVLTVDDYIASAMAKLGAVTRAEAVALALAQGPLDR